MISVEGDNGLGPLVGMRALEAAMQAAATNGLALALVKEATISARYAPTATSRPSMDLQR